MRKKLSFFVNYFHSLSNRFAEITNLSKTLTIKEILKTRKRQVIQEDFEIKF